MARPWQEMVKDFPAFRRDQVYRVRIRRLNKSPKPKGISVLLEFLDHDQLGRALHVFLPLPIRPAGVTASLFAAAGMDPVVGKTIHPKDALGAVVGVRLTHSGTGAWTVVGFEKLKQENSDASDS